jgi:hypothetical protein
MPLRTPANSALRNDHEGGALIFEKQVFAREDFCCHGRLERIVMVKKIRFDTEVQSLSDSLP